MGGMTDRIDIRPVWEYTSHEGSWRWDAVGLDGWELVAVVGLPGSSVRGYFKRQTGWQVYKSKQIDGHG